jgi:hypothetical protein
MQPRTANHSINLARKPNRNVHHPVIADTDWGQRGMREGHLRKVPFAEVRTSVP